MGKCYKLRSLDSILKELIFFYVLKNKEMRFYAPVSGWLPLLEKRNRETPFFGPEELNVTDIGW